MQTYQRSEKKSNRMSHPLPTKAQVASGILPKRQEGDCSSVVSTASARKGRGKKEGKEKLPILFYGNSII